MGIFDFLFGIKSKQIDTLLKKGAMILDVRTDREYKSGAIVNSKHIPLDDLQNHVEELKQIDKPIIVCCQSGARSAKAVEFLNLNNIEAINGGGWQSLKKKL